MTELIRLNYNVFKDAESGDKLKVYYRSKLDNMSDVICTDVEVVNIACKNSSSTTLYAISMSSSNNPIENAVKLIGSNVSNKVAIYWIRAMVERSIDKIEVVSRARPMVDIQDIRAAVKVNYRFKADSASFAKGLMELYEDERIDIGENYQDLNSLCMGSELDEVREGNFTVISPFFFFRERLKGNVVPGLEVLRTAS